MLKNTGFLWAKFARTKFCPRFFKRYTQEAQDAALLSLICVDCGIADEPYYYLRVGKDAAPPKAGHLRRTRIAIAGSPAPAGRQVRLCPSKAER